MNIRFIFALVVIVATVVAAIVVKSASKPSNKDDARLVRNVLAGVSVALLLISSVTIVGTRRIGVATEFGRPTDSLSNGLHFIAPWQKVNELDGSIQTDDYIGDGEGNSDGPCIDIRIGNESTACTDTTVRWRIVTTDADQLYRDFRNMDNIRRSLVTRELNAALNEVLGEFNPLDAVNLDDTGSLASLDDLADAVTESVRERVEGRVEIISVTLPLIRYDNGTQARLNDYQQEIARTRVAEQAELTAAAQGRANDALADSVSNDPNVLVAQCFGILDAMVRAEQQIPAGFSCWPGGGSAVVIPAANVPQ